MVRGGPLPEWCFNATTAFLLLGPRDLVVVMGRSGFNATTAFLLPDTSLKIATLEIGFNATTAFLLR